MISHMLKKIIYIKKICKTEKNILNFISNEGNYQTSAPTV